MQRKNEVYYHGRIGYLGRKGYFGRMGTRERKIRVAEPENLKTVPVPTFYLNTVPVPIPAPVPGHIHAYTYTYTYMCISS
jgi:hypothetical protein